MKDHGSLRIALIYFIFSLLWIVFSDRILEVFVTNVTTLSLLQTYKGLFFIFLTSTLLFFLIRHHSKQIYEIEDKQEQTSHRLKYVIQGANLGYWDWEYQTGKHFVNDKWLEFIGLKRHEIENMFQDWSQRIHPDDLPMVQQAVKQTILDSKPFIIEFRMKHKDGHWVWIEGSGAVVQRDQSGNPTRISGTHKNITYRKKAEKEISFLALNDTLTKLPNRAFLGDKIEAYLQEETKFSFLFLDLDNFKNINDLYGHSEGDRVIKEVARRLENAMGKDDFISRVGGDEFVILHKGDNKVKKVCQHILDSLKQPFIVQGKESNIGGSIGVSYFPDSGKTFEELFKNADTAMYAAKNSLRDSYKVYTKEMTDSIVASTKMDSELQSAIKNDEFVIFFQPQIDLCNNKIIGAEALVRWQKPGIGLIFPDAFIKKAESTRAIVDIGKIVLKKSLINYKKWHDTLFFKGSIAINISLVQFEEEDFIDSLLNICQEVGVAPKSIDLEITESHIMKNPEESIKMLQKLKDLNFGISIDDFGTGYSSLSYIKKLPIHKLKIDRSFIKDLPCDSEDKAISRAIISLAKNIDIKVLAEGVETHEQQKFLAENFCDSVQGYLYSKPIDEDSFYAYLKTNSSML